MKKRNLNQLVEIKIGMGVTMCVGSDCYAYEIVEIIDNKHCLVRELDHKCIGGYLSNEWELISNPQNPLKEMKFTYGRWRMVERVIEHNGVFYKTWTEPKYQKIYVGIARYYYDYSF